LSISWLPKHIKLWPCARRAGRSGRGGWRIALSLFNNLAVSCGAYVLGVERAR
jgi:hypothetical protein